MTSYLFASFCASSLCNPYAGGIALPLFAFFSYAPKQECCNASTQTHPPAPPETREAQKKDAQLIMRAICDRGRVSNPPLANACHTLRTTRALRKCSRVSRQELFGVLIGVVIGRGGDGAQGGVCSMWLSCHEQMWGLQVGVLLWGGVSACALGSAQRGVRGAATGAEGEGGEGGKSGKKSGEESGGGEGEEGGGSATKRGGGGGRGGAGEGGAG